MKPSSWDFKVKVTISDLFNNKIQNENTVYIPYGRQRDYLIIM